MFLLPYPSSKKWKKKKRSEGTQRKTRKQGLTSPGDKLSNRLSVIDERAL
jgi:hypothetical protein